MVFHVMLTFLLNFLHQRLYLHKLLIRVFKLWKCIIHLFTGMSELESLCLQNYTSENVQKVEACILNSSKLESDVYYNYPEGYRYLNFHDGFDDLFKKIFTQKNINSSEAKKQLFRYLSNLSNVNIALNYFHQLKSEKYDENNEKHELLLEQLWSNLKPNKTRIVRKTKEWQEIGFQGDNPSTDFRGMGILGLMCLVHFSKNQASKNVLLDSNHKTYWYPFSVVGILVSNEIYLEMISMKWNHHLFNTQNPLDVFYLLFTDRFIKFNDYLMKNKCTIMDFEGYRKKFFNK